MNYNNAISNNNRFFRIWFGGDAISKNVVFTRFRNSKLSIVKNMIQSINFLRIKIFGHLAIFAALALFSACTSSNINDGLRPSAQIADQNSLIRSPSQLESPNQVALLPSGVQQQNNTNPSAGVTFLPVIGPPQFAVTRLSNAVRKSATNNAVTIIPNGQSGATYQIKGYFSALDDGSGTILVYIWDVLDASAKTVHRISGEERTSARKADPWSAINSETIDKVIARTMQNLRDWMDTRA